MYLGERYVQKISLYSRPFPRVTNYKLNDVYLLPEQKGGGLPTINSNFMYGAFIGEGDVPYKEAFRLLKESGYKGYYSLKFGVRDDASPLLDKFLNIVSEQISE